MKFLVERIGRAIEAEALNDRTFGRAEAVLLARKAAFMEPALRLSPRELHQSGPELGLL